MSDFKLKWDHEAGGMDMVIENDDLGFDAGLETSALLSLFTDQRADEMRGWFGDTFAEVPGDLIGSTLWQLERGLITADYEVQFSQRAEQALQWMIDDGIAASVSATTTTDDVARTAEMIVTIRRPNGDEVEYRFSDLWSATIAV